MAQATEHSGFGGAAEERSTQREYSGEGDERFFLHDNENSPEAAPVILNGSGAKVKPERHHEKLFGD
jgi:hypothetical protein